MKKRVFSISLAVLLIVLVTLTACAKEPAPETTTGSEPTVLTLATWSSSWDYMEQNYGMDWFVERCYARSDGDLIIEFKGGPEAIGNKSAFEAMTSGIVDIITTYPAGYEQYGPHEAYVLDIVNSDADAKLPSQELIDLMDQIHQASGAKFLGRWADFYPMHFFFTKDHCCPK